MDSLRAGHGLDRVEPADAFVNPLLLFGALLELRHAAEQEDKGLGENVGGLPFFQAPVLDLGSQIAQDGVGNELFTAQEADLRQLDPPQEPPPAG